MSFLLWFFAAFLAFAQDSEFRLEGSYTVPNDSPTLATVQFTLQWDEAGSRITGSYSDNYFISSVPVTGAVQGPTKVINIEFPIVVKGAKRIELRVPDMGVSTGSTTTSVSVRDGNNNEITNQTITSGMQIVNAVQNPERSQCTTGFGALTRFCGVYKGEVEKNSDTGDRCRGMQNDPVVALATDTRVNLYLGFRSNLSGLPFHQLGTLPLSPMNTTINQQQTSCGPLPGTTFEGGCRNVRLNGEFTNTRGTLAFTGTYSIQDNFSGRGCHFRLNFKRVLKY